MKMLAFAVFLGLLSVFGLGCGDDADCRSACEKVSGCGLRALGLSCDPSCGQAECVTCISEKTCDEIFNQACLTRCNAVTFHKL